MKKILVVLLAAAFIFAACGCTPYLNVQVSREPAETETAEISEEPAETPEPSSEPSVLPDDISVPTGEYELGDITFECPDELDYYEEYDGTLGYTLEKARTIMLDIQAIPLDPDVDPVGDEEAIMDICEYAASSFIASAMQGVDVAGEPEVQNMTVDGTDAYYTVFEAELNGKPVMTGVVSFATENFVYLFPVICNTQEYEDMYFDLIDSIKILNPAVYTDTGSSHHSSHSANEHSTNSGDAVKTAEDYLKYSAFSRDGLVDQLVYEGFSQSDAEQAVDSLDVDWSEQCAQAAQDYLDLGGISESGLIDVLEYNGFSSKDAKAAVAALDADWSEQAVLCAQDYIEYTDMTDEFELIDQLEFEGFSKEDAEYGAQTALKDAGY